ncbi:thioredoxin family protein [Candidatus Nitrospira neomarina]|uniref:Thioredoxin family protein n=1 Tax=Candidatus Nitrospira neomarina TaxID=3020899 RepID=A0AA96JY26_9BACT|nr:thioredoxin family protein [Candidatus Nitrospira neomarina]WNM63750.1 thioredoxin family protein [Candidatus Nitrospira neomarina]
MALKDSTMLPLGTPLPHFELPDVRTGHMVSPESFVGKQAILVMCICRHCPYVVHVQEQLAKLGRDYQKKNVGIVAISSNDVKRYPQDSPTRLKEMAEELEFHFPYCYDESQEVAKALTAACTPDFFVFNEERKLVYRGQLDDSRPGNGKPVTGWDLRMALEAVLDKKPVFVAQKPSAGCSIKWKIGNEPDY